MYHEIIEAEPNGDSLRLQLPIHTSWMEIVLLTILGLTLLRMLVGFSNILFVAWAEINNPYSLVDFSPKFAFVITLPFLIFLVLCFLYFCYLLISQFTGKETLEINDEGIKITKSGQFPLKPKRYEAKYIHALHLEKETSHTLQARLKRQLKPDQMAFHYGAAQVRFGQHITEQEANYLLKAIQQRFPQYLEERK